MQNLRRAKRLAQFVLVWFVLSLSAAIASPLVNPQNKQLICTSTGGMTFIVTNADSGEVSSSPSMDCPLCATVYAPPPLLHLDVLPVGAPSYAAPSIPTAVITKPTASPLPARGPPNIQ